MNKFLLIFAIFCLTILSANSINAQSKKDTKANRLFAAIPTLDYNNTTGLGIGAIGQVFFKVNKRYPRVFK